MGKALIIKNADFSVNAIGSIEELYEDITNQLLQGVVATSDNQCRLYNESYNATSTLIPKFLILLSSSTQLYLTQGKGVEWFVPDTLLVLPFVYKNNASINSSGYISNSMMHLPALYIEGNNQWVTANDIYTNVGTTAGTYPNFNLSICRKAFTDLTVAQAIALGLRVRKLRGV